MSHFEIELTNDLISSNSGLLALGTFLLQADFDNRLRKIERTSSDLQIKDSEILRSYLGLLCLGKTSYESIDDYMDDDYFKAAIGVERLPSKESLRQRLEILSENKLVVSFIKEISLGLIHKYGKYETVLETDMIPVDFDVTPMDNSKSQKQGNSRTYKGHDGFAPMMVYIGGEGYMLNNEFREGKAHSNCQGTGELITESIGFAQGLTDKTLLARFDSGNDSAENVVRLSLADNTHYIVKKNFRRENLDAYIHEVKTSPSSTEQPRKGKEIYYATKEVSLSYKDTDKQEHRNDSRLVLKVTERTIDKRGQYLLIPEQEIEGWYTDLSVEDYSDEDIVTLYADHGTSEQFHSEFKTDMDMERLPSGKFECNSFIMLLGMTAFNVLRIIGQESLRTGLIKRKRAVKRIRIRKVLQDIMYMACHFMIKFKRRTIQIAAHCAYALPFMRMYERIKFA